MNQEPSSYDPTHCIEPILAPDGNSTLQCKRKPKANSKYCKNHSELHSEHMPYEIPKLPEVTT